MEKSCDLVLCTVIYCVGADKRSLISCSDGLSSSLSCRKMGKMRPMSEEMDGRVFFPNTVGFLPLYLK